MDRYRDRSVMDRNRDTERDDPRPYGRGREEAVASLINEYQRAWHIIEQLTEVNLELIRGAHPGGRRRKKRG